MRMPNSKEMSKEQQRIYLDAPLDESILVTGPPGTGKTVIAFLRAQTVSKLGSKSTVGMFNNVLRSYTSNVGDNSFDVTTIHKWIYTWWNILSPLGEMDGITNVYLECPFGEKDKAKAFGAKWDKFKKKWYVSGDVYQSSSSSFARWNPTFGNMELPKKIEDEWQHDWSKISEVVFNGVTKGNINKNDVNWGHLIIDEAQDLPVEMFEALNLIMKLIFKADSMDSKPAITVFADENQRLKEHSNSTINDIVNKLRLPKDRIYSLSKNYRNTLQIAKLAANFYTGLKTGIPDLPILEGELPLLFEGKNLNDSVEYIYRYAVNHENEDIGVITQSDKVRKQLINRLGSRLKESTTLKLQSYSSKDKEWNDSDKLEFDKGGVITVLNKQSCKGLEFDAVFLPELQSVSVAPDDKDQFMMEMYVMTSRARRLVTLMYSNEGDSVPAILSYIPSRNSGLLEYVNGK